MPVKDTIKEAGNNGIVKRHSSVIIYGSSRPHRFSKGIYLKRHLRTSLSC